MNIIDETAEIINSILASSDPIDPDIAHTIAETLNDNHMLAEL